MSEFAKSAESDWAWTGGRSTLGCDLVFVRDVQIEKVIEAFGMDPAQAHFLPEAPGEEVLRVGRSGHWAFAIDSTFMMNLFKVKDAVRELSRGGAAAWCLWTETLDSFEYLEDGIAVTSFEPQRSYDRQGPEPDRFVPQMRQTGLDVDRAEAADPYRYPDRDERICVLEMLTLALGIHVPAEMAQGPLLTVRRGPRANGLCQRQRPYY